MNNQGEVGKIFGDGSAAASVSGIKWYSHWNLFFKPLESFYFASGALLVLTGVFLFVSIPDTYSLPGDP